MQLKWRNTNERSRIYILLCDVRYKLYTCFDVWLLYGNTAYENKLKGRIQMNPREKTVFTLLSSYRIIPAMYTIMYGDGPQYYAAVTQLGKILCVDVAEIHSFLLPFKARITYAMQDFRHYVELLKDVPTFEEAYWPSMDEEAKLITNNDPFRLPLKEPRILDIGAGSIPYLLNFNSVCARKIRYYAVDKRAGMPSLMSADVTLAHYNGTYEKFLEEYDKLGWKPNVLFLANFLHCVKDVHSFFKSFMFAIPTLRFIKIIEIKPDSPMNLLFDYHMLVHCRGQAIDYEILKNITELYGRQMHVQSLSEHHNMYTIVL